MRFPMLPPMSLRRMLLLITGALTLLVVVLVARDLSASVQRLDDIARLRGAVARTNQFFRATESLVLERDLAVSLLCSTDPETDELLRPRLAAARRMAEADIQNALAALAGDNAAAVDQWQGKLTLQAGVIAGLREEIDYALALAPARRDPALADRWNQAVNDFMASSELLWRDYAQRFVNIDVVVARHLRFNEALRVIFDYSGRQRSLVTQILASRAEPTPQQSARLYQGDGILEASWNTAYGLAQQSGLYDAIELRYNDAKSQFDVLHDMMAQSFFTPGAKSQSEFPLSPAFWFELSEQSLESLNGLRRDSRAYMQTHVEDLVAKTKVDMLVQALVLLVALLLCGLSVWVVLHRVIRPIESIIADLMRAANGESVQFATHGRNDVELGKLIDVLHVVQGNTETLRRTAAELDRGERALRAIVDNAVDGIVTIDARGVILSFNPACERIFGCKCADIIGANISVLMPEPYRSEHDGYLARYAGDGASRNIGQSGRELMALRSDGSIFPIELSVSAYDTADGKFISGAIRDITQRKEAERALTDYMRALENSNKELDDFAYIASHDLKEPLRGIHNHSRFLLEDNAERLDEGSTNRLNRLLQLSQRMERLINDLLYYSRLGRQDLAIQSADLEAVIADIEATLDHFLAENGARIIVAGALPTIICDRVRVTEAFRNLITNAVKYNDNAAKKVEIGVHDSKRTPAGEIARRVFYVADNGCGIAPEFHDEVFRIFRRLQGRKSEQDGTGVGLTFVKKIVERHQGQIWIESELGRGTTFYFTLETAQEGQSSPAQAA